MENNKVESTKKLTRRINLEMENLNGSFRMWFANQIESNMEANQAEFAKKFGWQTVILSFLKHLLHIELIS